jgi:hypothetical protein
MLSLMEFVTPLALAVLALALYILHRKYKNSRKGIK